MKILVLKSIICILTILIFPFINSSNVKLYAVNPLIADHNSVSEFENIPDSLLPLAIPIRLMFQHASVGGTVNDGLDCVQGSRENPKECDEFPDYKFDRRNWEFQPRGNSGWYGKINDFVEGVDSQIDKFDIFSFKYCYLDGLDGLQEPCGSPFNITKTMQAWNTLKDSMETLENRYPNKKFVWWTIPLTQIGMYCTDTLNTLIRNYVRENGKILFDIADIEAYDTINIHQTNPNGWELAFKSYCGEQQPGAQACHPNWLGKLRLAKAFWWLMTKIADTSITDVIETNSGFSNNFFNVQIQDNSLIIHLKNETNGFVNVSLYNMMGRLIVSRIESHTANGKIEINTNNFTFGLYFLTVSNGESVVTEKIIIDE
ncbi:MAG: hypothetical protein A2X61_15285 [Ignavibacteria bacterium GWB2_35_12]|nr:MAG: hypothetical protein A2X61_15285 [Ignavibacteria bacterium GWB2_35_12]OGU90462.1 MAG: hypothetical protein A2220_12755 [Ignavibacteria bacterium RIFOXYA2_FULL_35_10]OGV20588.1 MAG: hypothetical protein A2475_00305 [Ignavibacteria bacterium RIFOXYC2_FULL_35_21]